LSTLTKILVVLLALSTIFLSGITVTYVGSATNYKKAFDERRSENQSLKSDKTDMEEQIADLQAKLDDASNNLSSTKIKHDTELATKDSQLAQAVTELGVARKALENNNTMLANNVETVRKNDEARKQAQEEVAKMLEMQISNTSKINQLQDQIVNLSATIAQLEKDNKRLIEEKTKIQNDLDRTLMASGQRTSIPSISDFQTAPAIKDINLEGVVLEVKQEDSLVSISIGSANGVKNNMRFHIIRNNSFVCDVVVTKVDADQASGYLDLVTDKMPKAGDKVKTNF
jgi:peptidoglycan hydrolase CwlO-like protein